MSGHAGRGDGGQATVEVALLVPLLAIVALAIVQVGVLVHDQLLVAAAAREAVRAAAVSDRDGDARRAAEAVGGLDPSRLSLEVTRSAVPDALVRVRVRYPAPTGIPLVGALLPDVGLVAESAMRSER